MYPKWYDTITAIKQVSDIQSYSRCYIAMAYIMKIETICITIAHLIDLIPVLTSDDWGRIE